MIKKELIEYLRKQGFAPNIVQAFSQVNREDFIAPEFKELAYVNQPLPIGPGATISQPATIALMLDLLELKDQQKILEIGSGSGYVLALLNLIVKDGQIYGVEILEDLVNKSKKVLSDHRNINIFCDNGFSGLVKYAPYDRILISATTDKIPEHLYQQLADTGILVCPVKNSIWQIKKQNNRITTKEFPGFVFVPLIE